MDPVFANVLPCCYNLRSQPTEAGCTTVCRVTLPARRGGVPANAEGAFHLVQVGEEFVAHSLYWCIPVSVHVYLTCQQVTPVRH